MRLLGSSTRTLKDQARVVVQTFEKFEETAQKIEAPIDTVFQFGRLKQEVEELSRKLS